MIKEGRNILVKKETEIYVKSVLENTFEYAKKCNKYIFM